MVMPLSLTDIATQAKEAGKLEFKTEVHTILLNHLVVVTDESQKQLLYKLCDEISEL